MAFQPFLCWGQGEIHVLMCRKKNMPNTEYIIQAKAKPTVLVVEDDRLTQILLSRYLEKHYHIVTATSAEEADRILSEHQVHCILMDISLNGNEDGIQYTKRLRKGSHVNSIPIIALTAHSLPEYRVKSLAAGCNAFLTKPIDSSTLIYSIQNQLS